MFVNIGLADPALVLIEREQCTEGQGGREGGMARRASERGGKWPKKELFWEMEKTQDALGIRDSSLHSWSAIRQMGSSVLS